MKIRILKNILVEVEKNNLDEVWDKQLNRWDELVAESITYSNKKATIYMEDGDVILEVPIEAFEVISEN